MEHYHSQYYPMEHNRNMTSTPIYKQTSSICTTPPHLRIASPKTPPTVIRRVSSASSMTSCSTVSSMSCISEIEETKIQPFSTYRLKAITQKVKSMMMTLTESGMVCLEFIKIRNGIEVIVETFSVSQDGQEIIIKYPRQQSQMPEYEPSNFRIKRFPLSTLPERYHKKYEHARKFVTLIQSKTPKVTLYNQQAKCMLMENQPNQNFEVHFYTGRKLVSNWSGMKLIDDVQGSILSLSSVRIQQQFSDEIQQLVTFAERCQQQCQQFEELVKSTASVSNDKNELFPVIIGKRPVNVFTPPPPAPPPAPRLPETNPNDLSTVTSSSCSSVSTDAASSVIRQIRVPKIGLASQLDNGDIWVEFEDGSHLGIKPTVTTVTYIDQVGLMTKYRKSEPLPENVKDKLASVPIVLEQLMASQKAESMSQ